jgi:hypothetical protein
LAGRSARPRASLVGHVGPPRPRRRIAHGGPARQVGERDPSRIRLGVGRGSTLAAVLKGGASRPKRKVSSCTAWHLPP